MAGAEGRMTEGDSFLARVYAWMRHTGETRKLKAMREVYQGYKKSQVEW